jgi:hypothetical protein
VVLHIFVTHTSYYKQGKNKMKKILSLFLILSSFSVLSASFSVDCVQDEGDDRYNLIFDHNNMAIIHTNDSNETELAYYDYAEVYSNTEYTKTISGGRFIVKLESRDNGYFIGSLFKLEGRNKVQLGSRLDCWDAPSFDIDTWLSEYLD